MINDVAKILAGNFGEARLIISHVLNISIEDVLLQKYSYDERVFDIAKKRSRGVPLAYLFNNKEFYGLDFYVDERVLIPRPETEHIIDFCLKNPGKKILELGVGSGCIIVTILKNRIDAYGVGVDLFTLDVALKNAEKHHVSERLSLLKSDWFKSVPESKYDIIISNPPYVEEISKDLEFEPFNALFTQDLDSYKLIAQDAAKYMHENSLLILEIGMNQSMQIQKICSQNGLKIVEIISDLQNIERVLVFKKVN